MDADRADSAVAFVTSVGSGSTEGLLLVRRLPTLAEPGTRYDVIDRTGNRRTQLVLPSNEHILGFGAQSIYVVETDTDGIQRLRRHPLSTSLRP